MKHGKQSLIAMMWTSPLLWSIPILIEITNLLKPIPVSAQTIYQLNTRYDGSASTTFISPNLTIVAEVENSDAPFGLTQVKDFRYAQFLNPITGEFIFDTNPTRFGLFDQPQGFINLLGEGRDKVFGTLSGNGIINFQTGVTEFDALVTIIGGEGNFEGASGILMLYGDNSFNSSSDPVLLSEGGFTLEGSILVPTTQTIPESETIPSLLSIGLTGLFLIVKKHIYK